MLFEKLMSWVEGQLNTDCSMVSCKAGWLIFWLWFGCNSYLMRLATHLFSVASVRAGGHTWTVPIPRCSVLFSAEIQTLNTGTLPEIQNSGHYLHIVRQMAGAIIVNLEVYSSWLKIFHLDVCTLKKLFFCLWLEVYLFW